MTPWLPVWQRGWELYSLLTHIDAEMRFWMKRRHFRFLRKQADLVFIVVVMMTWTQQSFLMWNVISGSWKISINQKLMLTSTCRSHQRRYSVILHFSLNCDSCDGEIWICGHASALNSAPPLLHVAHAHNEFLHNNLWPSDIICSRSLLRRRVQASRLASLAYLGLERVNQMVSVTVMWRIKIRSSPWSLIACLFVCQISCDFWVVYRFTDIWGCLIAISAWK